MVRHPNLFPSGVTRLLGTAVIVGLASVSISAEEVSVEEAVKYLLILASSAGSEGRVACKELDMVIQLKKQGISVDAKANIAWAFNPQQAKFYAGEGKLVACNQRKLFAEGGAIAFERISGKLTVFIHQANLERSGIKLPESFLRVAVKM
jgi:hypothetical protein